MRSLIVVPMNVLLTGRETTYYLSDSGAKAIVVFENAAL